MSRSTDRPHNNGSAARAPREESAAEAKKALAILAALALVSIVDRQLIGILAEPIKTDLCLSDTQLGLLTGLAFSLFYAAIGIPIARLADRGDRVRVVAISTAIWCAMTGACGIAPNFPLLLLARMGVAVGEAGYLPPATSLISDYFPPDRRASAISVLQLASSVAVFCAFFIGGPIAGSFGWRATFLIIAAPGIVLAIVVALMLPEPRRLAPKSAVVTASDEPSLRSAVTLLLSQPAYRHLVLGGAFASFTIYSLLIWTPSLFQRAYGWSVSKTGIVLGVAFGLGGAIGAVASGAIADRRLARDPGAHSHVPMILMICAIPLLLAGILIPIAAVTLLALAAAQLLSNGWQPNVLAAIQGLATARTRALASALAALVINVIGLGVGPLIIGVLSDILRPRFGVQTLRYAMFPCVIAYLLSAFHLGVATYYLRGTRKMCEPH